jgi:hypothetical protein
MKESPTSLIPEQCIHSDLLPLEYISLDSITYKMKPRDNKIQNIMIRDQKKLKTNTAPWMMQQIWNYPKESEIQLKLFAHPTYKDKIDSDLIQNINKLEEEDALWYLRKVKEPRWINAKGHQEIDLDLTITTLDTKQTFDVHALLDSGCMSSAISK